MAQGGPVGPWTGVHSWHGWDQEDTEWPKEPFCGEEPQGVQGDREVWNWHYVSTANTKAASDAPLNKGSQKQNSNDGQSISNKGVHK